MRAWVVWLWIVLGASAPSSEARADRLPPGHYRIESLALEVSSVGDAGFGHGATGRLDDNGPDLQVAIVVEGETVATCRASRNSHAGSCERVGPFEIGERTRVVFEVSDVDLSFDDDIGSAVLEDAAAAMLGRPIVLVKDGSREQRGIVSMTITLGEASWLWRQRWWMVPALVGIVAFGLGLVLARRFPAKPESRRAWNRPAQLLAIATAVLSWVVTLAIWTGKVSPDSLVDESLVAATAGVLVASCVSARGVTLQDAGIFVLAGATVAFFDSLLVGAVVGIVGLVLLLS